jgi:predicted PurR-regulated permease PerM
MTREEFTERLTSFGLISWAGGLAVAILLLIFDDLLPPFVAGIALAIAAVYANRWHARRLVRRLDAQRPGWHLPERTRP